jgi:signal transduction histidine kinase
LRLALLFGGVLVLSGAGLVAISYLLISNRLHRQKFTTGGPLSSSASSGAITAPPGAAHSLQNQQNSDLHQFLVQSLIALAVVAALSILLGWLVAGRALHPVRTMTARARKISERNLHERLALAGPDDELKDLGDTIDGLLARLEAAFDSQRQFVANASHELRTPLMLERSMIQVALADPDITLDSLRATCDEVLQAGQEQEQLIEALLTLARSQRGPDQHRDIDMAKIATEVLEMQQAAIDGKRLHLVPNLDRAVLLGDERLIRVLITNLLENAVRHNYAGGSVDVEVATTDRQAALTVTNTGIVLSADQLHRLLQPFQRLDGDRSSARQGLGLGLSIVTAVVAAHDGTLSVRPRPGGGLSVRATFPAVDPGRSEDDGGRTSRSARPIETVGIHPA